jgi:hypothetical protein
VDREEAEASYLVEAADFYGWETRCFCIQFLVKLTKPHILKKAKLTSDIASMDYFNF